MSLSVASQVDLDQAVRGSAEVALLRDGKCIERLLTSNFIAPPMLARTRQAVRANYAPSSALIGARHTDPAPGYPLTHLLLTSDSAAEAAATEILARGRVIGWTNKAAYSGADVERGGANAAESAAGPTQIKYVFDWPTHAANGTFQSLAWVLGNDTWGRQQATWGWRGTGFDSYPHEGGTYDAANDGFLFRSGSTNYRVGRVSKAAATFTGPGGSGPRIMGIANGALWTSTSGDNDFRAYTLGTSTLVETVAGAKANVTGTFRMASIAPAETEFWAINTTDATVQRLNRTTGAHQGTIPLPWVPLTLGTIGNDILICSTGRTTKWARVTPTGEVLWEIAMFESVYSSDMVWIAGAEVNGETWIAGGISSSTQGIHMHRIDTTQALGTRLLLPSAVTKTSADTLKVTYQFDFA